MTMLVKALRSLPETDAKAFRHGNIRDRSCCLRLHLMQEDATDQKDLEYAVIICRL
jgi:hypothetical protein